MADANAWITFVFQLVTLVVVSIGALWAYTRYALERGLLAPVQFTVEATALGPGGLGSADAGETTVVQVLLRLHNLGASTLIARDLRVDVRYLTAHDEIVAGADPASSMFGRVLFPHSVRRDLVDSTRKPVAGTQSGEAPIGRGFLLLRHDTFVQAGVEQTYTFTTCVPSTSRYILVWGSFEYAQRPYYAQRLVLRISRRLGLIQYSLTHVRMPHTAERVFRIDG
jgi:hypothetical protein